MIKEKKHSLIILVGLLFTVFVAFIYFVENRTHYTHKKRLLAESKYMAIHLWNLDQQKMEENLRKILHIEDLAQAAVVHQDQTPFVTIRNQYYKEQPFDYLFIKLGLLRQSHVSIPLYSNGNLIGFFQTSWINRNFYFYFYVGLLLMFIGIFYVYHLAYQERQERYSELVENANSAIVRWNHDGVITFFNEYAETFFGYKKEDIIGKPLVGSIVPETESTGRNLRNLLTRICHNPDQFESVVIENRCKDGRRVWLNWTHKRIRDHRTEETNIFSVGSDITEQKKAEVELEIAQRELIEAARMAGKAEIAISILHNIGNILTSINTAVTMLEEKNLSLNLDNLFKALDMIEEHKEDLADYFKHDPTGMKLPNYFESIGRYILSLNNDNRGLIGELKSHVKNITDIVSIQQAHAKLGGVMEKYQISRIIDDALKVDMPVIEKYDIQIEKNYCELESFLMDRHKVMQVILNLTKNSIDSLKLSSAKPRKISVNVSIQNNTVTISVMDNGVGISEKYRDKIFRYGFTTKENGHGFGLHGAANFVREMGGNITCHSDGEHKGAVFELSLPYKT